MPRNLKEEQFKLMREHLLPRDKHPVTIAHIADDEEGQQYARQLAKAFNEGGWNVSMQAAQGGKLPNGQIVPDGLKVISWEDNSKPIPNARVSDLILEALQSARIPWNGNASYGIGNVVWLCVGRRPLIVDEYKPWKGGYKPFGWRSNTTYIPLQCNSPAPTLKQLARAGLRHFINGAFERDRARRLAELVSYDENESGTFVKELGCGPV